MKPLYAMPKPLPKITPWERMKLFFAKPFYGFDFGGDGQSTIVKAKKVNGKVYIVEVLHYD